MSTTWQTLARWLAGGSSTAQDAADASIAASWPIAPGLVAVMLVAVAAAVAVVYRNETPAAGRGWKALLAGLRTCLVAIVVFMLCGWTMERHRSELPDLVVMLDDSASMEIADSYDDAALAAEIKRRLAAVSLDAATRLNLAKALLLERDAALVTELSQRYHLRFYLAGAATRAGGGDRAAMLSEVKRSTAQQPASRLGDSVRDALDAQRGRATAAIILLTDGITTDGKSLPDAAQEARRRSIPLFLVGLGSERAKRDLWLADLLAEDYAFVGDWLNFEARLAATGITGSATVRLKRSGDEEPLAEQTVKLADSGAAQTVRLTHKAEVPGDFEYVVEVVPQAGEVNTENNRQVRPVHVREATIRVLLVQAYPSYEFRFLKQMLVRELNASSPADKSAGVRTVLQEADLAYVETDKTAERAFPASREELFQYDVLIFGDVNPALLSTSIMNNIYEFVTTRGGGLVFIAGPRYTPTAYRGSPLAPLFPGSLDLVSLPAADKPLTESFRPQLTPLGLASPITRLADTAASNENLWRDELPPLRWLANVREVRSGVRVLAEHPTARDERGTPLPVFCLQFFGAGKVMFHATDETYRWRFRVGDVYFARYWVQLIRYLCRSKLLGGDRTAELTTDREQYRRGDTVGLRVRFLDDRLAPAADDGVVVKVERDSGEARSVTLARQAADRGVFEGSAGALPAGKYRAWLAAPALAGSPLAQEFAVSAPPGELAKQEADLAALREAAQISLGKYYTFSTAGQLASDLPAGRAVRVETLPPQPIWNAPLVAGLFVLIIAAEWLLRKQLGML